MNEFFKRILLIELHKAGFDASYQEDANQFVIAPQAGDNFSTLYIFHEDGEYLIRYKGEDQSVMAKVRSIRDTVLAITAAWESAITMSGKKFRKLLEWNGVVLAARDDDGCGLHLVTWLYDRNEDSARSGNYTTNINGALWDFIKRSGIIPKGRLLDDERLSAVHTALAYRLEHDDDILPDDRDRILSIISDLEEEEKGYD